MSRAWFFQANPKHYDIDGALQVLEHIWWRVPQHTTEVQVGDHAVLWRSGSKAGIVGVGVVLEPPQQHDQDPAEAPFVRGVDEGVQGTTRALLAVRPAPFVSKEQVRRISVLHEHQIVRAPMGTVFPLTPEQWDALAPLVPAMPSVASVDQESDLPLVFAWEQRAKGVLPMPGGYDGYLDSAQQVCDLVIEGRLTPPELAEHMADAFDLASTAARYRETFLRKMGLIVVEAGICEVSTWASKWLDTQDPATVVGLLHSRCQFIGEMLAEVVTPLTNESLLAVANDRYGLGWESYTQVNNRRGWLQSAGMIASSATHELAVTPEGTALLDRLDLYQPGVSASVPMPTAPAIPAPTAQDSDETEVPDRPPVHDDAEAIADELIQASTASNDPDRFERAVRDAFAFLGFHAQWLGGSGRTDVLLEAPLGKEDRYQVTVDAKTSASGSVGDQQVDWLTLKEHRIKHDAEHTVLVAPNPSAGRLLERATSEGVAVLSATQLAGLVRQHDRAPVGLGDYRLLFATGGQVDTAPVEERSEDATRLIELAAAICEAMTARAPLFGRLRARDLWLVLADQEVGTGTDPDELQQLLDTLASPLLGVLEGDPDAGYVVGSSREVTRLRLRNLGDGLARGLQTTRPGER